MNIINKGFTLVEMVITIALVIILSTISGTVYKGYSKKARMSEGYALIASVRDAMINYYSEYGNFLGPGQSSSPNGYVGNGYYNAKFTTNEPILGVDARSNKYFTNFKLGTIGSSEGYGVNFGSAFTVIVAGKDDGAILLSYNRTAGVKVWTDTRDASQIY
ncbi:MAG: prepilin-type N-terminal cleavage/methylation domain-containing protein [Elusimicrobia bacterium]|nr:prepilin-type N-terminal cleavage/methylation domain-containing protein [Elusimicrobiota bacterium]